MISRRLRINKSWQNPATHKRVDEAGGLIYMRLTTVLNTVERIEKIVKDMQHMDMMTRKF